MEGGWLASYIALWIVTVALCVLALSHSRLIGLLYERLGPGVARALADGPDVGTSLSELSGVTLSGETWRRRFPGGRAYLLIFVSPQCQACNELMPHARDFAARHGRSTDVVLMSVLGDLGMNVAYARFSRLDEVEYVVANRLADTLRIAATPYALRISPEGTVEAKGVVNNYEHLSSFLAPQAGAARA